MREWTAGFKVSQDSTGCVRVECLLSSYAWSQARDEEAELMLAKYAATITRAGYAAEIRDGVLIITAKETSTP